MVGLRNEEQAILSITELLSEDQVILDLQATDRWAVPGEMLAQLRRKGIIQPGLRLEEKLRRRETKNSTGLREGIAIPHLYDEAIPESLLAIGLSGQGIDYDLEDGDRIHLVLLLLGNFERQQQHIRLLARISRLFGQTDQILQRLLDTKSPQQLIQCLSQAEEALNPIS